MKQTNLENFIIKESKPRPKTSKYWRYFDEEIINGEKTGKVICNIKGDKQIPFQFNKTTSLKRYLEKNYPILFREIHYNNHHDRIFTKHEKIEIAKFELISIIMENKPLSNYQGKWSRFFMYLVNSNYIPSYHEKEHNIIDSLFDECKIEVKKELSSFKGYNFSFAQTSDGWKSIAKDHYYLINLHYIKDWQLKTINLGTVAVETDHIDSDYLVKVYQSLYKQFEIDGSEIFEVTDDGSNLVLAANKLGHKRLHCCDHSLNLVLEEGLFEIDELINKVSKIVQMFNQSHALLFHKKSSNKNNFARKTETIHFHSKK